MLRLQNVSRRFPNGVTALDSVTFDIPRGAFTVLLGPSGCGKSTLLRLLAGLDTQDSGTIAWDAEQPAPGEIGFVFQEPVLLPWAGALDNAALPLRLRGTETAAARDMLARLGLSGFETARPSQLSGGMRMRVSIARALAPRPRLLLMDEPFAALDEFTRHALQTDLREIAAGTAATTIFVTHSIYEAAYLATRAVILSPRPGRVAAVHDFAAAPPDRLDPLFTERVARLTESLHAAHIA